MGTTIEVNEKILSQMEESMPKAMDLVFKRCYQPWLQPKIIFNAYLYIKGYANIFQNVLDFHKKMIHQKRKSFNAKASSSIDKEENKCIVDILLELNEVNELSDNELVNEVITLLFAGSETSSIAVCSTLIMLAMHPDIQEKVYQEINDNVDSSNQHISIADLSKLTFLEQCLKESMRRYTVVPVVLRQTLQDISLNDGRKIPHGANIAIIYRITHQNEELYPNPRTWNPHNFDPEEVANRPAYSFNPFSVGPRVCIGYKYAMLSMKVTIATILRNYKLSTKQQRIKMSASFISRCRQGYFMELQPRQQEPISAECKKKDTV